MTPNFTPCTDCPAPAELNRTRCASCQAKNRAKVARHRAATGVTTGKPGRPRSDSARPESVRAREYYEKRRERTGAVTWAGNLIQRLKHLGYSRKLGTTWYNATLTRYREHVAACAALECEHMREPFAVFAREVVEAENNRARYLILAPMPMAKPEPATEYGQYRSPIEAA